MYTDSSAQEDYEKAQVFRINATLTSLEDVRENWLKAASNLEQAAELHQQAADINQKTKQRKQKLKEALIKARAILSYLN
jgi:hypothetical protein